MNVSLKRAAVLALLLAWVSGSCLGQQYSFRDYVDGMANLSVNCIVQDRAGFLWIGTESGLYQYDGFRFWQFGQNDGLPATFVTALALDRDGRLWVGTRDGLAYRNGPRSFSTVSLDHESLKIPYNTSVSASPDGHIYAASQVGVVKVSSDDNGLSWTATRFQPAAVISGIDPASELSVVAKAGGDVVFGCGKGVCESVHGQIVRYGRRDGLPEDDWKCLLLGRNGELWVRGPRQVAVLSPGGKKFELRNPPGRVPADTTYLSLIEDRSGAVLASFGASVGRYSAGKWTMIGADEGFGEGTVSAIFQDREGMVWFGLLGHGLRKWLGYGTWESWTTKQGLQSNEVWALQRDGHNRLWVADEHGLNILEPGSSVFKPWSQAGIDAPARSMSLKKSRDDFIWAATYEGKLIQINGTTLRGWQLNLPHVAHVFVDSHDRVWASTSKGLYVSGRRQGKAEFTRTDLDASDAQKVQDMAEDPDGRLWAISQLRLFRADGPDWKHPV